MQKTIENKTRIKDIAVRAGISPGTVDRVIHNRGEVAEKTRRHVLSIIDEMGYTPNLLAKSLASKKLYHIAVLLPDPGKDNPYWERPRFGIQQSAESIKDFNTRVSIHLFNIDSERSFLQSFHNLLNDKPDGLIFTPVFYQSSMQVVETCEERELPYIFVDMKLDGCNNLAYFGQDAEQSGFLAARLFHYCLPPNSEVVIIKPMNRDGVGHHLQRREKGFLSFFLSESNTKKINTTSLAIDLNDQKEFYVKTDRTFSTGSAIRGIFVANSRAYKVARYLYERDKKELLLVGYDLIAENLDFLERGIINFLIGQKPEEQGFKSVQAMFNYLISGKAIERTNYSPIDIIMKENFDYYKNYRF